ncbi:hypothetical protein EJB05_13645 [Eragrostis curvula]|uniref:Uncharacterized protein n=1 Tax=Eragrostis curvula TaxID=38414 RepID=A0A5J9VXX3_9POAL|nr:hypothetical protein EJB05_13645 [Eragrostis curvula]
MLDELMNCRAELEKVRLSPGVTCFLDDTRLTSMSGDSPSDICSTAGGWLLLLFDWTSDGKFLLVCFEVSIYEWVSERVREIVDIGRTENASKVEAGS